MQERGAGRAELVREHLDVGDATVVVDRDVHVLPPDPPRAPASIPMHPMPHPVDPPERLDVDVQEIAGRRPLIPRHRRAREQRVKRLEDAGQASVQVG